MRRAEKGQKKDDLRGTGRTKGMNYLEAVEDQTYRGMIKRVKGCRDVNEGKA